ncbi:MAG TPA: serine/threonine-protein kinase [Pseudonocardiaceae bacterium]|nr:serine/threonine-protein kinase [Pseudonocardiaceae bacterium]
MSEDLTGRSLGHYRIDGVLGRGGMSVMYRATDVRLDRKVALKVMGQNLTDDAEFRDRFADEARNTSAVDHANVVPLYDFGEVDGQLYIALRLVEGADLASLIAAGPLPPDRTLGLLGQVAEALDTVHGKGLVHLDVKPANVLVTTKDALREHAYLADFGLTRRGATGHRTRAGDFLGSPTYAAPEHLRGEPVDGRTDQYALACVLFSCLTGQPPFAGGVPDVISGHLNIAAPAVTSVTSVAAVSGLPATIDEVVGRGMAKDAGDRFGNCRALIAAARTALHPVLHPTLHSGGGGDGGVSRPAYPRTPRPSAGEPVRLRPPVPATSSVFTAERGGSPRWLAPTLAIAVLAVLIVVLILVFTAGS